MDGSEDRSPDRTWLPGNEQNAPQRNSNNADSALIQIINNAVQAMFVANREKWADTFHSEMLGSGIDVKVALEGEYKDRVIMTNERLKRPMVDMLTRGGEIKEGSLLYNLQQLGMKRATFSDGVGWKVYYEIDETGEMRDAYKKVLGPMGLGADLIDVAVKKGVFSDRLCSSELIRASGRTSVLGD